MVPVGLGRLLLPVVAGGALLAGACGGSSGPEAATQPTTVAAEPGPPGPAATAAPLDTPATPLAPEVQAADPERIRIPAIGVDAAVVPLGLRDDGHIEVPTDFDEVGWWVDGPEPGEPGPAVLLGHVDSWHGPAVFFDLTLLAPGDAIHVDRVDGTAVTYLVERTEQHPKDAFPTEAVYGPTVEPALRLVTCGGDFDRDRRSYNDKIIVFARLADR